MSCEGGDADDIPAEAYSLLHKIASQWNGIVNVQELVLKILQGSMTNRVYECHWSWEDGHCPKKVLVRIYGNSANLLFERENEIITFERMSQLGHGPRLLGRFPNGRLEEFLDARVCILFFAFYICIQLCLLLRDLILRWRSSGLKLNFLHIKHPPPPRSLRGLHLRNFDHGGSFARNSTHGDPGDPRHYKSS